MASVCTICGRADIKQFGCDETDVKSMCGDKYAHRECMEGFCVFCGSGVDTDFYTCAVCKARIHKVCAVRESRRPRMRRLGHHWSGFFTLGGQYDDDDIFEWAHCSLIDRLCATNKVNFL